MLVRGQVWFVGITVACVAVVITICLGITLADRQEAKHAKHATGITTTACKHATVAGQALLAAEDSVFAYTEACTTRTPARDCSSAEQEALFRNVHVLRLEFEQLARACKEGE